MTRSDKWNKRPCVLKYWAFKDEVRLRNVQLPNDGFRVIFTLPMPKSWNKRARQIHFGEPHKKRPDLDNLVKALCDAVFDEDSKVWNIHAIKQWGDEGSIKISPLPEY